MRSSLCMLVLAVWLGRMPVAAAETGNEALDAAVALYDDLEYQQAVVALATALAQPGLSQIELTTGYRYLALSYMALGRDADAIVAYGNLLEVEPGYELPATEGAKAQGLFAQAQEARPRPITLAQSASPATPRAGEPVTIDVRFDDPDGRVKRVNVLYRARGGKGFSSVQASGAAGVWRAVLPGTFVAAPGLEYHVAALGEDGAVLAAAGSAEQPLELAVMAATSRKKPVYATWWFWTGVGAAALGGAAAIILLSGDDGGSQDASVTITVN